MTLSGERIALIDAARSVGGGGTGLLNWGPDFGGVNGDRLAQSQAVFLLMLELIGNVSQAHALQITELALEGGVQQGHALALTLLELTGSVEQAQAVALSLIEIVGFTVAASQAIAILELGLIGETRQEQALAMTHIALDGETRQRQQLGSTIQWQVIGLRPTNDCWIPEVALCPDDAAHDNDFLRFDSVVATRKDCYLEFPVGPLGGNNDVTVISADMVIALHTATPVSINPHVDFDDTPNTFDETTLRCSTAPPAGWAVSHNSGFTVQGIDLPGSGYTIPLDSTGVQTCINSAAAGGLVIRIAGTDGLVSGSCVFHDREAATNLQPRMHLVFTTPA